MGKSYPAILEQLYEMLQFIREEAFSAGFNKTYVSKIELAAEEALVNIINHGYPTGSGSIEINCNKLGKKGLEIVIIDKGLPFDPLKAVKTFEPANALSDDFSSGDQLGGYGIYFIVNMMDQVDYKHVNGSNVLTLRKYSNPISSL